MVTRRDILVTAGAVALASHAALAQQNKIWRVGFLVQRHIDFTDSDYNYGPFTQGMRELGYVVGRNLVIEWRSAEGNSERLPELASELVQLKVDVLAVAGTPATLAAQKVTSTIPIVMVSVGDPVNSGLIKSLARPGNNTTGLSNMNIESSVKRLELLRSIVPKAHRFAIMVNPTNTAVILTLKNVQAAAKKIGLLIQTVNATSPEEIAGAFVMIARQNAEGLIVPFEQLFVQQTRQVVALAAKQRLPSIGMNREYAEAGGLMSYGPSLREINRRAATYVDKIFKGAKPGEIPVEQPTIFELYINRKTANLLGLKIPATLIGQATQIVD